MKEKDKNSTYESAKKIRGDWNGINPVTRIIPDKKKKYSRRKKHKNKEI